MLEPVETNLLVRGRHVAARIWGAPSAPPVLALHGWLDNAASFDLLAPLLPEFRIVAVDLPGHGLSDHRPSGVPYHYVDWVIDVTAMADVLGWERFSILGHSMGAGIASLFAGTFPNRVSHLVLLDGLGPLTADPEKAPARLAAGVLRLLATDHPSPTRLPNRHVAVEKICQAIPGLLPGSAEILLARGLQEVGEGLAWRSDPRLRVPSLLRMTQRHVNSFLKRIECPVLVVRAEQGFPIDTTAMQEQFACLKNAQLIMLPGGHHLHLDNPASVAPRIRAHLGRGSA
jgi:pimeloyl-ACP methyl ester carboxylesterase